MRSPTLQVFVGIHRSSEPTAHVLIGLSSACFFLLSFSQTHREYLDFIRYFGSTQRYIGAHAHFCRMPFLYARLERPPRKEDQQPQQRQASSMSLSSQLSISEICTSMLLVLLLLLIQYSSACAIVLYCYCILLGTWS